MTQTQPCCPEFAQLSRRGLFSGAVALAVLPACAHKEIPMGSRLAPSLVLEQFMRAANAKDLQAMAKLFGNKLAVFLCTSDPTNPFQPDGSTNYSIKVGSGLSAARTNYDFSTNCSVVCNFWKSLGAETRNMTRPSG